MAVTRSDHVEVLTAALRQIPGSSAVKILVRIDGAGAIHDLLDHLERLNTARRRVRDVIASTILTNRASSDVMEEGRPRTLR